MYVNMAKEIVDNEGKVIERKAISFDLETTTPELIGYFTKKGYVIIDYSEERRA